MSSMIDPTKPADGVPAVKAELRQNLLAAKTEIEALQTGKAEADHDHDGQPLDLQDQTLTRPALKNYAEVSPTIEVSGGTLALDLETGNVFEATLTASATLVLANPPASGRAGSVTLLLRQDGTGGRSLVWPPAVKWAGGAAPAISAAPGAIDVYSLITRDGGTTWYGFVGGQAFA